MEETYGCHECGNQVGDDEFVTNWGSCSPCFDKHYNAYVRRDKRDRFLRKLAAWSLATVIATVLFLGGGKIVGIILASLATGGR